MSLEGLIYFLTIFYTTLYTSTLYRCRLQKSEFKRNVACLQEVGVFFWKKGGEPKV